MNNANSMATPTEGKTILVVEDNHQAAKVLSMYLTQAGYRVIFAENGRDALRKAAQLHPHAITLDILLPDMDGWQVLTKLKASEATMDIPVVIVSVLDRQPLGFQLGAMEFLVKPVERSQLLRAIRRCVRRQKFASVSQKVMVVHSEIVELHMVSSALSQEGYDIIEAMGSAEAIHLAKSVHPDLLVMNISQSNQEGCLKVIAALHADPETSHIPTLILAAQDLPPEEKTRLYREAESLVIWTSGTEQTLLSAIAQLVINGTYPGRS